MELFEAHLPQEYCGFSPSFFSAGRGNWFFSHEVWNYETAQSKRDTITKGSV